MTERDDFVVWVIDDDEAVRDSLEALLSVWGYRVEACDFGGNVSFAAGRGWPLPASRHQHARHGRP